MRLLDIPDIAGVRFRPGITEYCGRQFDKSLEKACRVTPWENDTQGFFVAVLEKYDELPERIRHEDPHAPAIQTKTIEDPDIAPVLENIERYYGISPQCFAGYRFHRPTNRDVVYCLDSRWDSVISGFQRAGLGLAKRRGGIWRLSHSMIQQMGPQITKNVVSLSETQMAEIATTGEVFVGTENIESPYPVIDFAPLGRLATTYDLGDGRIRWKRPCNYRWYAK